MADFTIKQNDTRRAIQTTLKYQDSAVDLSAAGTSVKFLMKNIKGNLKVDAAATKVDASNGVVKYEWSEGDTDTAGSFRGEFEVTWDNGEIETFPSDSYIDIFIKNDLG